MKHFGRLLEHVAMSLDPTSVTAFHRPLESRTKEMCSFLGYPGGVVNSSRISPKSLSRCRQCFGKMHQLVLIPF